MRLYLSTICLVFFCVACSNTVSNHDIVYDYPSCRYPFFERDDGLNFGFETGYFRWLNDEKIHLLRDRNHLSIQFHEEYGEAFHDSVLAAYNITTIHKQGFGSWRPFAGFYRVNELPAEEYYTSYGSVPANTLGDLPQVEFVLPVFYRNHSFCDLRLKPEIAVVYQDHITDARKKVIQDSLMKHDNIEIRLLQGSDRTSIIYVTKESPLDPYRLYHRYHNLPFFKIVDLNYTYTISPFLP
jgi:hypothetical protein